MPPSSFVVAACAVLLTARCIYGASHTFQLNEPVKLYANKVGPFANPRYMWIIAKPGQVVLG